MRVWNVQDAKAKFSEVIDKAVNEGPQMITKRGVEIAVVVAMEEWKRMQGEQKKPLTNAEALKILQSGPQFDLNIPPRGQYRHRKPVEF